MEQKFYLLTSLIEKDDSISTKHFLFSDLNSAINALEPEILSCSEYFNFEEGKFEASNPTSYEFRNQDGHGFQVWIEELTPI